MIARRSLLRLGTLFAAAGGTAVARAPQAAAAPGLGPSTLAGLTDLPANGSPVWIPDQGWFAPVQDAAPGEADGIVRVPGADGTLWQRMGVDGTLDPDWFARPEDGPDDAARLQRACDHAKAHGPFAVDLGNRRHVCLSRLRIDPTTTILRGTGAILDFSGLGEPTLADPVATLPDLIADAPWRRDDTALIRDDGDVSTLTHFLTLPDAGRYRISLTVTELTGASDFPALTITVSGAARETIGEQTIVSPGTHQFEVEGGHSAARLALTTDARVRIGALTIAPQGIRECILIGADESSAQYGHKWMGGFEVVGPGAGTALHGLRFETNVEAKSSRLDLRDMTVRGFQTGLVFSHRSYLVRGESLRIACETGMHFLGGLRDAGELISFSGGVIDGGRIAVLNNAAEVAFFGTAIDFVDQVFAGSGRLMLRGCHLEVNRPTQPDRPLIDLGAGDVTIDGGSFGVTGSEFEKGNQCDHVFELRTRAATASMDGVFCYNLRSRSGALAGGPGRLDTARLRGYRPRHIAPVVQFDTARNLLGHAPVDLRTSEAPDGPFERFPTDATSFKVSPLFRHVWLVGLARPGAELGFHFRARSAVEGAILVTPEAFDGDLRLPIAQSFAFTLGPDWQTCAALTGDTHPASPGDGRMPDGFTQVALHLDLNQISGTVEFETFMLNAV